MNQSNEKVKRISSENETLQQKLADMSIQLLKANTLSESDKKKLSEEIDEKKIRIEVLEHQNELLLSQIHSFNIELESLKLKLPKENDNNNSNNNNNNNTLSFQSTSTTTTTPSSDNNNNNNNSNDNGVSADDPSLVSPSKEVRDLRELLVFTSREKDIIQTDLTTSKQMLLRLDQDMKEARKKIEMLNEENQHYRERESKSKSDENHAKLLVTIQENNEMREKKAKLQEEFNQLNTQFEEKSKKLTTAIGKLKKANQLKTTLETKISQLEENVNILTAENTKLKNQVDDLTKNRMELSKYNEVEHKWKEALQSIEELNKSLASKDDEIKQINNDKQHLMDTKNKFKNAYDNLRKSQVYYYYSYY